MIVVAFDNFKFDLNLARHHTELLLPKQEGSQVPSRCWRGRLWNAMQCSVGQPLPLISSKRTRMRWNVSWMNVRSDPLVPLQYCAVTIFWVIPCKQQTQLITREEDLKLCKAQFPLKALLVWTQCGKQHGTVLPHDLHIQEFNALHCWKNGIIATRYCSAPGSRTFQPTNKLQDTYSAVLRPKTKI